MNTSFPLTLTFILTSDSPSLNLSTSAFPKFLPSFLAIFPANKLLALPENKIRFLVLSFTSDWLFPTKESRGIVSLLNSIGSLVSSAEVVSDRGHDSFLLDEPQLFKITSGFLKGIKL